MAPLQAMFVIESFGSKIRRNSNRIASGVAAGSGANRLPLLFHLSEKKKRHNPIYGYALTGVFRGRLTSTTSFCYFYLARQKIHSRNIEGDPFDSPRLCLHQY
jgi:hypothetical protein